MFGFLAALPPSIPTHDRDLFLMALGGIVLLIAGGFLIRYANRRRTDSEGKIVPDLHDNEDD